MGPAGYPDAGEPGVSGLSQRASLSRGLNVLPGAGRCRSRPVLQQAVFGQTVAVGTRNYDVVEHLHVDQRERGFERLGQGFIGT